jgi:hypothetical protein
MGRMRRAALCRASPNPDLTQTGKSFHTVSAWIGGFIVDGCISRAADNAALH